LGSLGSSLLESEGLIYACEHVQLRVNQLKLNHVFNILNNTAPPYLNTNFTLKTSVHSNNTRSGPLSLAIPSVKSFGIKSFFYTSSKLWNSMPGQIQTSTTKSGLKRAVKQHLQSQTVQLESNSFVSF